MINEIATIEDLLEILAGLRSDHKIEIEKRMSEFTNRFSVGLIKDLSYYKNLVKKISYE